MTPITAADVRLLRVLANVAEYAPERMRAGHLAARAEELADRLAQLVPPATDDDSTLRDGGSRGALVLPT